MSGGDTKPATAKFRASPWVTVTYNNPSHNLHQSDTMDGDVDMDAPQISTLSDEGVSPPPQAKSRLRVKLLVKEKSKSASAPAASSSNQKNPDEDEGDEDDEDQEDQLIDDDEPLKKDSEAGLSSSPKKKSTPNNKGPAATNAKTKPRKNLKRPPEEGRLREKVQQQPGAPNLSPTMLLFDAGTLGQPGGDVNYQEEELPSYSKGPPKKKQKKAPALKEKKEKEKSASKIKVRLIPPQASSEPQLDREDALSEAMTGTVASSPAVNPVEDASHASHSPEPEASFALPPPAVPPPQPEEINLDGVPIPVYPLPNKPFPVLPPPKVGSGLAPIIPLDRSGTKVRQWRVALREIRGIGGGRWFTRAWVGDKQSQFASEVKVNNEMRKALADSGVAIPKLPTMSISAPTGKGKGKAKAGTASSLSQSAAPSRAESLGPEGIPPPGASISTVRAPSKMRISQVPPPPSSEAGDSVSDMLGPPDV
ncbi:hypothetical protein K435DRAFT_848984 [Dendrothele bispora CBS 962.96]|uniref:Uncharacterized protein n=1 Tax=Dendrothele bispora (strain CBS 962.96) TaxID=1314807 RepID=A0A4S8MVP7_DENBC|nr:hypothetical protein K435DRAFT_848984 [Dendrothele bispora CBS 962.96]